MRNPRYPKKGLGSYLLPFILILALLGSAFYIAQNNVNIEDIKRVFKGPELAKDEKVKILHQGGSNQIKPWSDKEWKILKDDEFIQVGDTLKTASDSDLVLEFFEDSQIRLSGSSQIKLIRLDKDEINGDHLALELVSGRVWRRGPKGNNDDADFIINTPHMVTQMNKAVVMDVSASPEIVRILGGTGVVNVARKRNGARVPISRLILSGGEQLLIDDLTLDDLKVGEKDVVTAIDESYFETEWYQWNIEMEERLGPVVEIADMEAKKKVLELLEEGLVTVTTPGPGEKIGTSVLVQGTYDKERISKIYVNGDVATLGVNDEWESSVPLSEQKNTITVTAQEIDSDQIKEAVVIELDVDTTGPAFGKITNPEVDANNNGVQEGDGLELIGEISSDAVKVCVSHNGSEPAYCLKQFSAGDETYRYVGGVSYGNIVTGENKYSIVATDELGNSTTRTVYLFKDVPVPDTAIEPDENEPESNTETGTDDLSKPTITDPDPSSVFETGESSILIRGTVDSRSRSLLLNGRKTSYSGGSEIFELNVELTEGENLIKLQSVDSAGNKSKTSILTVIYLKEVPKEE